MHDQQDVTAESSPSFGYGQSEDVPSQPKNYTGFLVDVHGLIINQRAAVELLLGVAGSSLEDGWEDPR